MCVIDACTADTMVFLGCFGWRDSKMWLWLGWGLLGLFSRRSDLNSNVLPFHILLGVQLVVCWPMYLFTKYDKKAK
jgi:hypothetical protein